MKRLVVFVAILFGFFITILSSSFTQAVPACGLPDDDQLILRLSDITNAHGEFWNQGNYQTEICYNQIFGLNGNGIRTCDGSNNVLRLSGNTNAHAERPAGTTPGYVNVCYGDLKCIKRDTDCIGAEKEVVSLSGNTNAHLETNDS
ncbi:MAG: hypothetical protein AABY40_04325, partial [Nanoarchaeota archaeon]